MMRSAGMSLKSRQRSPGSQTGPSVKVQPVAMRSTAAGSGQTAAKAAFGIGARCYRPAGAAVAAVGTVARVTPPDADAGSLDAELDALYAAPPEEFVAARAASAKRLRAAGRRDEASAIAAARKPTAGAALVNALARAEPGLVAAAIDAVEAARTAIERGEGVREALERQRAAVEAAEAPLAVMADAASAAVARQATETLRAA